MKVRCKALADGIFPAGQRWKKGDVKTIDPGKWYLPHWLQPVDDKPKPKTEKK